MSQLKWYVSTQTLTIFYSSHILLHISSSTLWDGCGESHLHKLNSLRRPEAKLPDKKKIINRRKIESPWYSTIAKQLDFNKAVLMFKLNRKMTPSYIISLSRGSNNRTSLFRESNNRSDRFVLTKPRADLYKTSL